MTLKALAHEWEFQAPTSLLRFRKENHGEPAPAKITVNPNKELLTHVRGLLGLAPFAHWGDDRVARVISDARLRKAAPREVLSRAGDPAQVLILARGVLRVSLPVDDAVEGTSFRVDVARLSAVDVLGLAEMLDDRLTTRYTVVAETIVDYVIVPLRRFSSVVARDAQTLDALQKLVRDRLDWDAFCVAQGAAAALGAQPLAVDRYRAAGYFTEPLDGNDLEVLKMATQRNPRLLFERLSLL